MNLVLRYAESLRFIKKKYDVDILVSRHFNTGVVGTELGIPSLNVADPNSIMGYDGLLHFGGVIYRK